jgi:multidrug efflux pump subunit AcrA (membrane-fusion protein)
VQQKVTRYVEATGYTSAINTTNLVARVQGFLQKINYKDGDEMKAGATLFVIEPEPYKLKLEQAQAGEAGAQAILKQAETEFERHGRRPSLTAPTPAGFAILRVGGEETGLHQQRNRSRKMRRSENRLTKKAPYKGRM